VFSYTVSELAEEFYPSPSLPKLFWRVRCVAGFMPVSSKAEIV